MPVPYYMIRPEYQADWVYTNDSDPYVGYMQSPWNGQYFPVRDFQGYTTPPQAKPQVEETSWLNTVRDAIGGLALNFAPYFMSPMLPTLINRLAPYRPLFTEPQAPAGEPEYRPGDIMEWTVDESDGYPKYIPHIYQGPDQIR